MQRHPKRPAGRRFLGKWSSQGNAPMRWRALHAMVPLLPRMDQVALGMPPPTCLIALDPYAQLAHALRFAKRTVHGSMGASGCSGPSLLKDALAKTAAFANSCRTLLGVVACFVSSAAFVRVAPQVQHPCRRQGLGKSQFQSLAGVALVLRSSELCIDFFVGLVGDPAELLERGGALRK